MDSLQLHNLRKGMLLFNSFMILGICAILLQCTSYITQNGQALSFLYQINYVPTPPNILTLHCILMLLLFVLNITLRENMAFFARCSFACTISYFIDMLLCIGLFVQTNYIYNGIFLLCIAYTFHSHIKKPQQIILMILYVLIYVFCEYDLLSQWFHILSLGDYLSFVDASVRLTVYTLKSIFASLNIVIFIVYMYFCVQYQMKEKSKINQLYEQQYHLNEELKLANIQLKHVVNKSEENARTRERNRLAREIHDILGHSLTAITTGLVACKELLERPHDLQQKIDQLSNVASNALVEARRSVRQLRPDSLVKYTFYPAIQELATNISQVTHTEVVFEYSDEGKLTPMLEDVLYRIIQESITNAVRHGQATQIHICLEVKRRHVVLDIFDNGIGCHQIVQGSGMTGMTERIEEFGGTIHYESTDGFAIHIFIPLKEEPYEHYSH